MTIALLFNIYNLKENIPTGCTKVKSYVIGPGDTLWSIGRHYVGDEDINKWIDEIRKINNIDDCGRIQPGQRIKIEDWNN